MSGRGTGNRGLGRFIRQFDQEQTTPLFLRILPKKYHKEFQSVQIKEETLHTLVNHIFEGMDVRDELQHYLDLPPRFRFVNVKDTRPIYDKLCKDYLKQTSRPQKTVQQKTAQKQQVKSKQKMTLKCDCQKL